MRGIIVANRRDLHIEIEGVVVKTAPSPLRPLEVGGLGRGREVRAVAAGIRIRSGLSPVQGPLDLVAYQVELSPPSRSERRRTHGRDGETVGGVVVTVDRIEVHGPRVCRPPRILALLHGSDLLRRGFTVS